MKQLSSLAHSRQRHKAMPSAAASITITTAAPVHIAAIPNDHIYGHCPYYRCHMMSQRFSRDCFTRTQKSALTPIRSSRKI
ncbi:hypothetical protein [Rhizobium bangladeshense]|uniref:hypothetical protein n=1 Tax=Rhizobium bangladeshense TaxID=1138189 RepID=UPI001FD87695|nr:hypothetical protein [Rhizobium bangladeshense]